jgi:hypothetical protein
MQENNATPPSPDKRTSRLPNDRPRLTFGKVLLGIAFLALVAGIVFWATNIRQPGTSFSRSSAAVSSAPELTAATTTAESENLVPEPIPLQDETNETNKTNETDNNATNASIQQQLKKHIVHLSRTIGQRNLRNLKQLNAAADFVQAELKSYGLKPRRHTYQVRGFDCHNIEAEIKGSKLPKEIIIIGAHYDSFTGTPGANDNGSGTAAMLVLAKQFAKSKPDRTLRFVAWTNEEPPYFQNRGLMGSWVYAEECRQNNDDIKAVLSLETMGYFTDAKNSQKYPAPLNLMYPSTGNFIGFVANLNSRSLQRRVIKTFRQHAKIPSEGASLPDALPGVGWSDHWSFWQEGYAGVMVTDTAPFRYPHYHKSTDTPDKINYPEMAKVVAGLNFVVKDLVTAPPREKNAPPADSPPKQ